MVHHVVNYSWGILLILELIYCLWILCPHWIPLHNINCAHSSAGPLLKFNGYCILIPTNIIGTGTLDHCTFRPILLEAGVYGLTIDALNLVWWALAGVACYYLVAWSLYLFLLHDDLCVIYILGQSACGVDLWCKVFTCTLKTSQYKSS